MKPVKYSPSSPSRPRLLHRDGALPCGCIGGSRGKPALICEIAADNCICLPIAINLASPPAALGQALAGKPDCRSLCGRLGPGPSRPHPTDSPIVDNPGPGSGHDRRGGFFGKSSLMPIGRWPNAMAASMSSWRRLTNWSRKRQPPTAQE